MNLLKYTEKIELLIWEQSYSVSIDLMNSRALTEGILRYAP